MAFSSGFLDKRIIIKNKVKPEEQKFGETTKYEPDVSVWANVTWKKGQKALNEGALDSVDTVLIRMRYNCVVRRDSLIVYDGRTYQVQSLHSDRRDNTVQITAAEIVK